MTHDQFIRAFEDIVDVPHSSLKGSEALEDLDGWDSVGMVTLMGVVAENGGVQLSPRSIARCSTVDELFRLTQPA